MAEYSASIVLKPLDGVGQLDPIYKARYSTVKVVKLMKWVKTVSPLPIDISTVPSLYN
mgnify:FL=1